jgi:hypothetical protein
MGDALGVVAARPQALGEAGKLFGDLLGQGLAGAAGLELAGVGEDGLELPADGGVAQLVESDPVDLVDGVGPVGVDLEGRHVGDDEERRVLEGHGVLLELGIGGAEVLALALVLPGEVAALPDVGPALAAGGFRRAALEGISIALGVGVGRRVLAQERAEVIEVRLRGGTLGEG